MKTGYKPEEAIIGAIAVEPKRSLKLVKGIIFPEHFSDFRLSDVFKVILDMDEKGEPIDAVTLISKVNPAYISYLTEIFEGFPGSANIESYRDDVIRKHHERNLKEQFKKGIEFIDAETIKGIKGEWSKIESLGQRKFNFQDKLLNYTDDIQSRQGDKEPRFNTGFSRLDGKLRLIRKGEMCVIGARTSIGKTSLMLEIMLRMADQGHRVLFVSGEMSFNQLMDRILSIKTEIDLMTIRNGELQAHHWPLVTGSLDKLSRCQIQFTEASRLSLDNIFQGVNSYKPDVLFVDYIQRFTPDKKIDSRASYYSDVANTLKGISTQENIAVITASQLGRGVEQRKDEPRISDLKESGGIEEAADVVWLLHVDKDVKQSSERIKEYKMIISKNRNGPTFSFECLFDSYRAMFMENGL